MNPEHAHVALYDKSARIVRVHAVDFPGGLKGGRSAGTELDDCYSDIPFDEKDGKFWSAGNIELLASEFGKRLMDDGFRTVCSFPLISPSGALGTLNLASKE